MKVQTISLTDLEMWPSETLLYHKKVEIWD